MEDQPHLLLFGDQTVETLSSIQNLFCQSRTSTSVSRFLSEATDVIQIQASKLNAAERKRFFGFETILDLAERYESQQDPDDLVATVLMCISQLGELIIHAERDSHILNSSSSPVFIIGLCTGLLPAAAAAAARDTSDLLRIGAEIVAVAFRLGLEASRRSMQIEQVPGSWGVTVINVRPEEQQAIIDAFNRDTGLPPHRRVYISVLAQTWATISGPPSVLADLFAYSPLLASASKIQLPFGAPAHAPHLPLVDVDKIIGPSVIHDTVIRRDTHVISTSSCEPFVSQDLGTVLCQATHDVLQHMLCLSGTIQAVVSRLVDRGGSVKLTALGPTSQLGAVQNALEAGGIKVTLSGPAEAVPMDNIRSGSNLIAIVGMSGRFPGSESVHEFWETLQAGQDFHKEIPKSRFDIETHFDPTGAIKNTTTVPYGCFLDNPGLFDSRLFNVSPREAAQMDPIQRLLLMTSYEALEMAGYSQDGTLSTNSKRIATYFGQAADDWREVNASQDVDVYYIPATVRAFAPGRLNYHYKWGGASYSLDSACASSSTAVLLACNALIARDCDTALAGGGSLLTSPTPYAGLSRANFLSPTGGCKTFCNDADGYCRGEGVGVVVLKRLEDAITDNDNIQAVIRGGARNYSSNATSITHPSTEAQQLLYRGLLQKSCVEPDEVGFVEMHGTATQAGDMAEMTSVTSVFGNGRAKNNPLIVGAVKANVGHGEAAAGVTSLIKTILMLRKNTIPPQPGMPRTLNAGFPPLEKMNVHVADEKLPFKATSRKGDGKRKILLNNFDAAGGNTSLLIEDAPAQLPRKGKDPRTFHTVTISARTPLSLKQNTQRLLEYLAANPSAKLSDLAYTTTARRMHEVLRVAYPVQTIQDLTRLLATDSTEVKRPVAKGSVAFAFTGQGSQYAGMGRELFATCSRFRESILYFQSFCDWQGFPSFVDLIARGDTDMKTKTTVQVQLAIVSLEIALADLWKSWGIEPDLVIGHSLGEYAALCASSVLSVQDTLYLVGRRATMIQEECTPGSHAMLAIQASSIEVEQELGSYPSCQISCMNGPSATVVSGTVDDIHVLQNHLQNKGIGSTLLQIPYGFHSPQIDPILADFEACAQGVHFGKPQVPVVSTLKGSIVTDVGVFTSSYLAQQARQAVNFVGAMHACNSAGLVNDKTLWIEIGPQPVCTKLIRSTLEVAPEKLLPTLTSSENNWKTISTATASAYASGAPVNWLEYHKEYIDSLSLLELPTYAFDLKEYWIQYEGDWALKQPRTLLAPSAAPVTPSVPGFPTTTLQRVQTESIKDKKATVTFESLTSDPKLLAVIQGHLVNGVALCPSSVYTDMAYTAAKYIHQRMKPGEPVPPMSVSGLTVTHPLIPQPQNPEQTILVTAVKSEANWTVDVTFSSKDGSSSHEHGYCRVSFSNASEWKAEWSKVGYFVKAAKDTIVRDAKAGEGHRLLRAIVYKLFANLVVYDEGYQAIEEVFLENDFSNAVATLKLKPLAGTGQFTFSPHWIDSILHVAGFVLNGKPMNDDDTFYISTGFDSLRIAEGLNDGRSYTSYVHMETADKKGNIIGDVYIFNGEEIIGMCSGVVFQKMNRVILDAVIGKAPANDTQLTPLRRRQTRIDTPMSKTSVQPECRSRSASKSGSEADVDVDRDETPFSSVASDEEDDAEIVIAAVLAQTGFDPAELEPSTMFANMGLDSLMTIEIIGAIKKKTGMVLPASFFNHNPTVADVRRAIGKNIDPFSSPIPSQRAPSPPPKAPEPQKALASIPTRSVPTPVRSGNEQAVTAPPAPVHSILAPKKVVDQLAGYESNVVLIQGSVKSDKVPLFLLADGSGSATSYIHLPALAPGVPVYALESPFLHAPEEYVCSIEEVSSLYLASIRKTRPHGPYLIGGWSAGAVYAYEVSKRLLDEGETIHGLFLLDMHVPKQVDNPMEPTMELLELTGLTTGVNRAGFSMAPMSMKLKEHLLATVKALLKYSAVPMDPARRPAKTYIIWATLGLAEVLGEMPTGFLKVAAEHEMDDETKKWLFGAGGEMEPDVGPMEDMDSGMLAWFYGKRDSFGPKGWEQMVGENIEWETVVCDHFSMVNPPHAKVTGEHLRNFIANCMP